MKTSVNAAKFNEQGVQGLAFAFCVVNVKDQHKKPRSKRKLAVGYTITLSWKMPSKSIFLHILL